jgi:hypothetical protein
MMGREGASRREAVMAEADFLACKATSTSQLSLSIFSRIRGLCPKLRH